MTDKQAVLTLLRDEFDRWETLLGGMTEAEITERRFHHDHSIKDEVAHLWSWQQRSIVRLEAALYNREPIFPNIPGIPEADIEEDTDRVNAWIYEVNRDKSWAQVHREWRAGFLCFLELGEALPEPDFFDKHKYRWMDGYSPADIMTFSYEHHHVDHYEELLRWLNE